ncbi:MAG: hypothetical protein HONBIEJF_02523 [Fimbriimonadaceae bacterium]|nr:hypothetical protein [Fimbriimonadaceae bacterium]
MVLKRQPQVLAYGVSKSQAEWLADTRCVVDSLTLRRRLIRGWDPERAIATEVAPYERRKEPKGVQLWRHDGEEKSLYQWARDPRCQVTHTALVARIRKGIPLETALSKSTRQHAGFGETRSIDGWLKDPRCKVPSKLVRRRLADGWDLESAITHPRCPTRHRGPLLEAFGEQKTLVDWCADPRCRYTPTGVKMRLQSGLSLADAITGEPRSRTYRKRAPYWSVLYRAYGEEKQLAEWIKDRRFEVVLQTFLRRVATGMSPEAAMSKKLVTPPKP